MLLITILAFLGTWCHVISDTKMYEDIKDELAKYSIKLLCYLGVAFPLYYLSIGFYTNYWLFLIVLILFGIISYLIFRYLIFNLKTTVTVKMITIGLFIILIGFLSYYFNEILGLKKANIVYEKYERYELTIDSLQGELADLQYQMEQLDSILYTNDSDAAIEYLKKIGLIQ